MRLCKVARETAAEVARASLALLGPLFEKTQTITANDGRELAQHERIAEGLGARFYFARPYACWKREINENSNGLVSQRFPKQHDFTTVTDAEVERIMERLNSRPRETLGFRAPNEVFFKHCSVAFHT